jgi:MYXO-CTERM domain-containing protein
MVACGGGCAAGQVCQANQCVSACSVDVCAGVSCGDGQACDPSNGNCIADPCLRTNCGSNACSISCDGTAQCAPHAGVDVLATGGGGLSCQITGTETPAGTLGTVLLLLGLVAARIRRRRS